MQNKWEACPVCRDPAGGSPQLGLAWGLLEAEDLPKATCSLVPLFIHMKGKKTPHPKNQTNPQIRKPTKQKNQVKITLQGGKCLISWAGNIKEGQKGPPPLGQWVPRYGASRQFPTSSWMAKALPRAWGGQGHPAPTRLSLWALKHHSTPKVVAKGKGT